MKQLFKNVSILFKIVLLKSLESVGTAENPNLSESIRIILQKYECVQIALEITLQITPPKSGISSSRCSFCSCSDTECYLYCMASNYLVPGNTPPSAYEFANIDVPRPFPEFNGEYNAFMNPNALQAIALYSNEIDVNIVPLDCTNFANLNPDTIVQLNAIAAPYLKVNKNLWVENLCNYFVSLLATTLVTKNSPLYLWDLCATNIALNADVDQGYILTTPIVTTTGKIIQATYGCNDKVKLFNYLSYGKLLLRSIQIIFNDPAYKA